MIVLTIRTDKPDAELGLYDSEKRIAHEAWQAHRELSITIHKKIDGILNKSSISADDLQGIVIFKGPGSFTGLRIGFAVANALAANFKIPITARSGDDWIAMGITDLQKSKGLDIALPDYGKEANTTTPRK